MSFNPIPGLYLLGVGFFLCKEFLRFAVFYLHKQTVPQGRLPALLLIDLSLDEEVIFQRQERGIYVCDQDCKLKVSFTMPV